MTLTEADRDAYEERMAICTIEGVSEQRAAEIAMEQVRPKPPEQLDFMAVMARTLGRVKTIDGRPKRRR
jgi:hypothetical protein